MPHTAAEMKRRLAPVSLSSLTQWHSDLEAGDGTQGKCGTRARLCRAEEASLRSGVRRSTIATTTRMRIWLCSFPKKGSASPLLLQGVPEPKAGKNRMHLDIVADDVEAEVHRLEVLGAHRIDEGVQSFGGTQWVRMSDPEQNEFCVSTGVEW